MLPIHSIFLNSDCHSPSRFPLWASQGSQEFGPQQNLQFSLSTSVTQVTQDHFYSISASQDLSWASNALTHYLLFINQVFLFSERVFINTRKFCRGIVDVYFPSVGICGLIKEHERGSGQCKYLHLVQFPDQFQPDSSPLFNLWKKNSPLLWWAISQWAPYLALSYL